MKTMIVEKHPVEKVEFFDVLIIDAYCMNEQDYAPIDSTTKLTVAQVLEFISEGGGWDFLVVPHGKDGPVFMSGHAGESLIDAERGWCEVCAGWTDGADQDPTPGTIDPKTAKGV